MNRVSPDITLVVVLALCGATLLAQRAPRPTSSQLPVFRASTQYVAMDVIVRDNDDRPVTDLTKGDFVITEGGAPQTIADFAYVSIPVADRAVDLDEPPPPPSDVATNGQSAENSRALVLVVDNDALRAQDLIPLKRVLAEFLKKLSPDDQVALTYVSRSDLGHDFTNDIGELRASVKLKDALGLSSFGGEIGRIRTLGYVVRTLAASPQSRRAVILIGSQGCSPAPPPPSGGLPSSSPDSARTDAAADRAAMAADTAADQCRDLITRARRADVAFYTLDPRIFTDINSVNGIGSINAPGDAAGLAQSAAADVDSMKTLAAATGGRAFSGISDPLGAVQAIMLDNSSYYLLGFYPQPLVNDGKFHDVTVRVTRPGLRVRARPGYLAGTDKPSRPSTPTRDMTGRLGAGLDDPGLPIRAVVVPIADEPHETRALVAVEVDYPRPAGASRTIDDELRMGVLSLTPDGKIKQSFQRPSTFTGAWRADAPGVLVMDDMVDLPHGRLSVRIGVTSRALAKTGTAHIFVTVPDFSRKDLQLSPLVLGSSGTLSDVVSGFDLIRPFVPFQPATSRSFTRADTLRVFARAFWKSNDETVSADVSVKGGSPFPTQQITLAGTLGKDGHREATLDRALPLRDLSPGSYVLRVAVDSAKHTSAVREVRFDVR